MKRTRSSSFRTICATAIAFLATVAAARAQTIPAPEATIPERQSVLQRPRPDYSPLGIPLGGFLVFPSADAFEYWDTNVFATPTDTKSDFVSSLEPAVTVASNWGRHALNFTASDQTERFWNNVSENISNVTVGTEGRLDVLQGVYFTGGGGYQLLHEQRSSPNAVFGKTPTEYHVTDGNIGFVHESGLIGLRVKAAVDSYDYNNTTSLSDATIDQNFRDYIAYTLTPRVTYEIVPGYSAFIQAPLNERQYVSQDPSIGARRSSHGYEGDAGVALHLGAVTNGDVYIGYFRQDFEARQLSSPQGLGGGADVLWNVTQLTSVKFAANRTVQETDIEPASAIVRSLGSVTVEHELLPNVLLNASGTYFQDDFRGINRTDNNVVAAIGARYMLNRTIWVSFEGDYYHRDSSAPGVNFDRELIGIRFHLQR